MLYGVDIFTGKNCFSRPLFGIFYLFHATFVFHGHFLIVFLFFFFTGNKWFFTGRNLIFSTGRLRVFTGWIFENLAHIHVILRFLWVLGTKLMFLALPVMDVCAVGIDIIKPWSRKINFYWLPEIGIRRNIEKPFNCVWKQYNICAFS